MQMSVGGPRYYIRAATEDKHVTIRWYASRSPLDAFYQASLFLTRSADYANGCKVYPIGETVGQLGSTLFRSTVAS